MERELGIRSRRGESPDRVKNSSLDGSFIDLQRGEKVLPSYLFVSGLRKVHAQNGVERYMLDLVDGVRQWIGCVSSSLNGFVESQCLTIGSVIQIPKISFKTVLGCEVVGIFELTVARVLCAENEANQVDIGSPIVDVESSSIVMGLNGVLAVDHVNSSYSPRGLCAEIEVHQVINTCIDESVVVPRSIVDLVSDSHAVQEGSGSPFTYDASNTIVVALNEVLAEAHGIGSYSLDLCDCSSSRFHAGPVSRVSSDCWYHCWELDDPPLNLLRLGSPNKVSFFIFKFDPGRDFFSIVTLYVDNSRCAFQSRFFWSRLIGSFLMEVAVNFWTRLIEIYVQWHGLGCCMVVQEATVKLLHQSSVPFEYGSGCPGCSGSLRKWLGFLGCSGSLRKCLGFYGRIPHKVAAVVLCVLCLSENCMGLGFIVVRLFFLEVEAPPWWLHSFHRWFQQFFRILVIVSCCNFVICVGVRSLGSSGRASPRFARGLCCIHAVFVALHFHAYNSVLVSFAEGFVVILGVSRNVVCGSFGFGRLPNSVVLRLRDASRRVWFMFCCGFMFLDCLWFAITGSWLSMICSSGRCLLCPYLSLWNCRSQL